MFLSQSLTLKLGIHVHSNIIQKKFWTTAKRMRYGSNLFSACFFTKLSDVEKQLKAKGSKKSPLSRRLWSNKYYHTLRHKAKLTAQETNDIFTIVLSKYKTIKKQLKQHKIRYYDEHTGKHWYPTKLTQLKKRACFKRPWIYESRGKSWSFSTNKAGHPVLSIGTVYGRVKLPYKVPPYFKQYIKPGTKYGAMQVLPAYPSKRYKHGRWTIHLTCTVPTKALDHDHIRYIVSSDRGMDNVIWTYDNHNHTFHVSGKDILRRRMHYKHMRTQLQKRHSHSAHRKVVRINHRENRWRQNVNFNILKALYNQYPAQTLFGLEKLTGIKKASKHVRRHRRYTQMSWAFFDLQTKWEYKAQLHNSTVRYLPPNYTSQRCPIGHEIRKSNRDHTKHRYKCNVHHCEYNDDMVGALNIYDLINMAYHGIKHPGFKKSR